MTLRVSRCGRKRLDVAARRGYRRLLQRLASRERDRATAVGWLVKPKCTTTLLLCTVERTHEAHPQGAKIPAAMRATLKIY
ncbi:uncharacterized protein CIMG_10478 [Coccidioides immitis RS]|uniref:Uncharacterized protein n=4 Tax=Coccidioides immitis TaxID=5501 RepID=A0A0D8JTC2_COCIM|nr:uncharacterized protein CIMG_10478 [Coccidioides immitis RS]KJF60369.1 hypothetical protein CIMG_10478 [Coccidioides immitis RS]KMO99947.1 hypothetical protein CIRG_00090 [Coccidioides immitis RMSCC 2394]KMU75829.1 hypothetical protein CISG_05226 [Coccidioides immitis RMSCC 3703]KMU88352.1 hypothetical protein CIHG_06150 [Coccidioides immitis H538.4]